VKKQGVGQQDILAGIVGRCPDVDEVECLGIRDRACLEEFRDVLVRQGPLSALASRSSTTTSMSHPTRCWWRPATLRLES